MTSYLSRLVEPGGLADTLNSRGNWAWSPTIRADLPSSTSTKISVEVDRPDHRAGKCVIVVDDGDVESRTMTRHGQA